MTSTEKKSWSQLAEENGIAQPKKDNVVQFNPPPPPEIKDIDPQEELWANPEQVRRKLTPMPTEVFGPLQTWVDCTSVQFQVQPEMVGLPLLASVGILLGRRTEINFDQDRPNQPISVYSLVVAAPGERKSPVFGRITGPIEQLEADLIERAKPGIEAQRAAIGLLEQDLKVQQKLMSSGKDQKARDDARNEYQRITRDLAMAKSVPAELPQLLVDDVTMERLAVLMMDQGGAMGATGTEGTILENAMGKYSGKANLGLLLKAWDGSESYKVDRINRDPVVIPNPRLTLNLAVQPDLLRSAVGSGDSVGRGLMGRFLMAVPESMVGYRKRVSPKYDKEVWSRIVPWIYESGPDFMTFSHEAWLKEVEKEDEWEERLRPTGDLRSIRDWAAKISSHSIRLAAIFHVLRMATGETDYTSQVVEEEDVDRAHTVIEWMIDHVIAAHQIMGIHQGAGNELLAEEVLKWIRSRKEDEPREWFSASSGHQALKNKGGFKGRDDFDRVCAHLVKRGWLRVGITMSTNGRPKTYNVNPRVYDEEYEPDSRF